MRSLPVGQWMAAFTVLLRQSSRYSLHLEIRGQMNESPAGRLCHSTLGQGITHSTPPPPPSFGLQTQATHLPGP